MAAETFFVRSRSMHIGEQTCSMLLCSANGTGTCSNGRGGLGTKGPRRRIRGEEPAGPHAVSPVSGRTSGRHGHINVTVRYLKPTMAAWSRFETKTRPAATFLAEKRESTGFSARRHGVAVVPGPDQCGHGSRTVGVQRTRRRPALPVATPPSAPGGPEAPRRDPQGHRRKQIGFGQPVGRRHRIQDPPFERAVHQHPQHRRDNRGRTRQQVRTSEAPGRRREQ